MFTGGNGFKRGFTLIELLIVVAIIAILAALILAGVSSSRLKAHDTAIKNDVGQIRWQAEIVYDTQGASYTDWTQDNTISDELTILLEDIDKHVGNPPGAPYAAVLRDTQETDYCISAPLRALAGSYACIDATGTLQETTAACPDEPVDGDPLRCPS